MHPNMTYPTAKTVVIFGATGTQGGAVAKALLRDPLNVQNFKVRAISRDPTQPAAKALVEQGAEVVKADLEDKVSLRLALAGAYAVFLVTNFLEKMDPFLEEQQAKNAADIAKELNVKHFIWSSLPDIAKISGNKFVAPHFDRKAAVDEYINSISLPNTVVRLGTYFEFLFEFVAPLPTDPLTYGLCFPGTSDWKVELPIINPTEDLGKWVNAILLNPEKTIGKRYNLAESFYTLEQIVNIFQQQGLKIVPVPLDVPTFKAGLAAKGMPEYFHKTLPNITQFIVEYGYYGGEGIEAGLELENGSLMTLTDSLKTNSKLKELIEQQGKHQN